MCFNTKKSSTKQALAYFKHDIPALWGQCQRGQQSIQSLQQRLLNVVSTSQLQQAVDQGVGPQLLGRGSSILCGGCWRGRGVSQRTGGWKIYIYICKFYILYTPCLLPSSRSFHLFFHYPILWFLLQHSLITTIMY